MKLPGAECVRRNSYVDIPECVTSRNADAPVFDFVAFVVRVAQGRILPHAQSPATRLPALAALTAWIFHMDPALRPVMLLQLEQSCEHRALSGRALLLADSMRAYADSERDAVLGCDLLLDRSPRGLTLEYLRSSFYDLLEAQHRRVFGEPFPL